MRSYLPRDTLSHFSARVTIPRESASVFLGPRRRRASRILILIVFLRFIYVMGSSSRSENSRFRAAIKILRKTKCETHSRHFYDKTYILFPLPLSHRKNRLANFEHLGLGNNREPRYLSFPRDSAWNSLTTNERNTRTLRALSPLSLDLVDSLVILTRHCRHCRQATKSYGS